MRNQIIRQLKEMKALQTADIPSRFAEKLFKRMLTETNGLCVERDRELKSGSNIDKIIWATIERHAR